LTLFLARPSLLLVSPFGVCASLGCFPQFRDLPILLLPEFSKICPQSSSPSSPFAPVLFFLPILAVQAPTLFPPRVVAPVVIVFASPSQLWSPLLSQWRACCFPTLNLPPVFNPPLRAFGNFCTGKYPHFPVAFF